MIKLGIDFDNTLITYDLLFKKAALEKNLIPINFPESKSLIRNYLREKGQENYSQFFKAKFMALEFFEAYTIRGDV